MHILFATDCLTNDGMVSVVFFLIIAYRPLIQSLSLNTAERLAGEDFYPVWYSSAMDAPWYLKALPTRYCRPVQRIMLYDPAARVRSSPDTAQKKEYA